MSEDPPREPNADNPEARNLREQLVDETTVQAIATAIEEKTQPSQRWSAGAYYMTTCRLDGVEGVARLTLYKPGQGPMEKNSPTATERTSQVTAMAAFPAMGENGPTAYRVLRKTGGKVTMKKSIIAPVPDEVNVSHGSPYQDLDAVTKYAAQVVAAQEGIENELGIGDVYQHEGEWVQFMLERAVPVQDSSWAGWPNGPPIEQATG